MGRAVYGKLWEYLLTYENNTIGYRFQSPMAGGFAVDVAKEDQKVVRLLRHYFNCKTYAKIPMIERNDTLLTPFEGNAVQVDQDSVKDNFVRLIEDCKKSDRLNSLLKDSLSKDSIPEYAKSVLEELLTTSEGMGSVSITYMGDIGVGVSLMVEDLYNLFAVLRKFYDSFGSVEVNMQLGSKIVHQEVHVNRVFVKEMYKLFGYNSLSSYPRCVKDIDGIVLGKFPVLGELCSKTLKSGRDCFVLNKIFSFDD